MKRNLALLAKLNWRFHIENQSTWARVLAHKYGNRSRVRLVSRFSLQKEAYSTTWAALKKGEGIFNRSTKWIAGKDSLLSVWHDKWLSKGTLRSLIRGPLNKDDDRLLIMDVAKPHGWCWEIFSFVIPKMLAMKIKATLTPLYANNMDRIAWVSSPSGDFNLKKAYRLASESKERNLCGNPSAGWVWKLATFPKIKCFLWKYFHQSIPVRSVLTQRGVDTPTTSPICLEGPETMAHSL